MGDRDITLCHYEIPWAIVTKYHGFSDRRVIDLFVRYATTVMERYKDKVKYWLTFNEINIAVMEPKMGATYGLGLMYDEDLARTERCTLPELKDDPQVRFEALHNQFVASAKTVIAGHKINPDFVIGNMICHITWYPLTPNPKDILECQKRDNICNNICGDVQIRGEYPYFAKTYYESLGLDTAFMNDAEDLAIIKEGTVDFYTFSYYMSNCVTVEEGAEEVKGNMMGGNKNPYLKASDWGWQIDPDGLRYTLNKLATAHGRRERLRCVRQGRGRRIYP